MRRSLIFFFLPSPLLSSPLLPLGSMHLGHHFTNVQDSRSQLLGVSIQLVGFVPRWSEARRFSGHSIWNAYCLLLFVYFPGTGMNTSPAFLLRLSLRLSCVSPLLRITNIYCSRYLHFQDRGQIQTYSRHTSSSPSLVSLRSTSQRSYTPLTFASNTCPLTLFAQPPILR